MPDADPTKALVSEAVRQDSEIADRVRQFAHKVLDKAEFLLERGNPYIQSNMVRSLMPSMAKALHERQEDDELAELRREFAALREEMHAPADPAEEQGEIPPAPTAATHTDERPTGR